MPSGSNWVFCDRFNAILRHRRWLLLLSINYTTKNAHNNVFKTHKKNDTNKFYDTSIEKLSSAGELSWAGSWKVSVRQFSYSWFEINSALIFKWCSLMLPNVAESINFNYRSPSTAHVDRKIAESCGRRAGTFQFSISRRFVVIAVQMKIFQS